MAKEKKFTVKETPKTMPFSPGTLLSFPVTKGASPNEFCEECGCHCDGQCKGNPCGGKK